MCLPFQKGESRADECRFTWLLFFLKPYVMAETAANISGSCLRRFEFLLIREAVIFLISHRHVEARSGDSQVPQATCWISPGDNLHLRA